MKTLILTGLCVLFIAGASQGPWADSLALDKADSQAQMYKGVRQKVFESAEAGMNQRLQRLKAEMLPPLFDIDITTIAEVQTIKTQEDIPQIEQQAQKKCQAINDNVLYATYLRP